MKLRTGFVSNSSSSSFIIAAKDKNNLKVKIEIEADLSKYISEYDKEISTISELITYYKNNFYEDFEDSDDFKQCVEEINKGNKIFFLSCDSDSGDNIEEFLCNNGINNIKTKDIIVIAGEGGY